MTLFSTVQITAINTILWILHWENILASEKCVIGKFASQQLSLTSFSAHVWLNDITNTNQRQSSRVLERHND